MSEKPPPFICPRAGRLQCRWPACVTEGTWDVNGACKDALAKAREREPLPMSKGIVTDAMIDAGGKALRKRQANPKATSRAWEDIPKSTKRKWLEHASAVLNAALKPDPTP